MHSALNNQYEGINPGREERERGIGKETKRCGDGTIGVKCGNPNPGSGTFFLLGSNKARLGISALQ